MTADIYYAEGLHACPTKGPFPSIDVRDETEVWLWLTPTAFIVFDDECIDRLFESLHEE